MKKILKLFLFTILTLVLSSKSVDAEEYNGVFEKSDVINNIYYYKHRSDTDTIKYPTHNFHEQAHIYRDSIYGNYVYCIESWQQITGSHAGDYQVFNTNHPSTNLSDDLLNKLRLIAYYGYGYKDEYNDHTSPEWYAYTQMLLWRYQAPQYEHYFVSSETSTNRVYSYDYYMENIENLVDNHNIVPSISSTLELNVKNKSTFFDNNNVLKYYEIVNNNREISVRIENNKLIVESDNYVGSYNIKLIRRYDRFNKNMKVYTSDNYQNVLEPGNLDPTEINITINVKPYTYRLIFQGDVPVSMSYDTEPHYVETKNVFDGIKFQIITAKDITDKNGNVIVPENTIYKEFTTTKEFSEIELINGEYKVVQMTKMDGYKNVEVPLTITSNKTQWLEANRIPLGIQLVKKNEIFTDEGKYDYINIPGIEFGLYAEEDIYNQFGELYAKKDTMVYKFVTNDRPMLKTTKEELIPGNYYFKELTQLEAYEINDNKYPYVIKYGEKLESVSYGDDYVLYITNYLKKSNINIEKIDVDSKKHLEGVEYSVYNEQNNIIYQGLTDSSGNLNIHIPLGKYFVRETKPLNGYMNDEKTYFVNLDETDKHLLLYNQKLTSEENNIIEENPKNEIITDTNTESPITDNLVSKINFTDDKTTLENEESLNTIEKENNELSEIIVDVPKTEKNDYLIYLLISLGIIAIVVHWKKRTE